MRRVYVRIEYSPEVRAALRQIERAGWYGATG
jgi:hypothetical protein